MSNPEKEQALLATMTNEPFQPVRLYYAIPDRSFVTRKLRRLECMVDSPPDGCWEWLFWAETKALGLDAGYEAVPKEKRPIILGRIRFPSGGGMTLQTNSIRRAIEAAKFFGPRLGPKVALVRCRMINRFFTDADGRPDELMKQLDRDVTVVDPRAAEAAFMREFEGTRTQQDVERVAARVMARKLESREYVSLVEDFPLAPEEETHGFQHLAVTLELRMICAMEHWRGNTHLTLPAIIMRLAEEDGRERGGR